MYYNISKSQQKHNTYIKETNCIMFINKRDENISVFEDTMQMIKASTALTSAVENSTEKTVIYHEPAKQAYPKDRKTTVDVTTERSFQAAFRLSQKYSGKRLAVLNFASATNPGGGVTRGSSAQEEGLCRCSTLYPCLNTYRLKNEFYYVNRAKHSAVYSDVCIYTPDVLIIKSDTSSPERLPENQWLNVDIITCAAPNLRPQPSNSMNPNAGAPVKLSDKELLELHISRGRNILSAAAENKADAVILGAFGCGAFRNDPKIVSQAYKTLCGEFDGVFDELCFAIYCSAKETANYDAFKAALL